MSQVWGIISVPYADVSLGSQNRGETRKCLSPLGRKSFWLSSSDCKIYEDEDTSEKYSSYVTAIIGKSNKDIISEISRFMKPRLYQILKRKDVNMSITEIA